MLDIEKFADTGQLFDNHYKLIRPLNTEGGTADVWLALDTTTVSDKEALDKAPYLDDAKLSELGLLVAIKIYKPKNALDIEGERRFREEFVIVFNCNHANLIHPTYFSIFDETPYLVLPYCQRGSSELLIGSFMNDDDLWRYIHDVTAGLNYLHHCNPPIIHQDIKPANVLIDDSGNYAITDFGISAKRYKGVRGNQDDDDYEEQSGTYAYMAPERFIDGNIPSAESDIWAFGATLYELLTGRVPFGEDGGLVQTDGKVSLPFKGIKISNDIKQLICACLSKNPSERPTAEQLLNIANQKKFKDTKTSSPVGKILATVGLLAIAAIVVWKLMPPSPGHVIDNSKPDSEQIETTKTIDELYSEAMALVDSNNAASVQQGVQKLEILAEKNYAPAQIELAKANFSLAEKEFQSVKGNSQELYDTVAIKILRHYDKAIVMAREAQENSLVEKYERSRDDFIEYVLKTYDDQIEWGHFDNRQVEEEFTQYKKAFTAAVDNSTP
jgi:serine/threonine protein kinase